MGDEVLELENDLDISEADKQANERIKELAGKADANDEEKAELAELKKKRTDNVKAKINKFYKAKREADEAREAAERRAAEAEERAQRLQEQVDSKSKPKFGMEKETIKVGAKVFYTDEALELMIENKEIDYRQAQKHIQERIKAEAVQEAKNELQQGSAKEKAENLRKEDFDSVLKEYPQFAKGHPDFNPDDPLYKETVRIYNNGYAYHPSGKGLSEALKEAKKSLKITDKSPDLSDDFSVDGSTVSGPGRKPEDRVQLTEGEKISAVRQFHYGGIINPATGKVYTEQEAITKILNAKKRNLQRR